MVCQALLTRLQPGILSTSMSIDQRRDACTGARAASLQHAEELQPSKLARTEPAPSACAQPVTESAQAKVDRVLALCTPGHHAEVRPS